MTQISNKYTAQISLLKDDKDEQKNYSDATAEDKSSVKVSEELKVKLAQVAREGDVDKVLQIVENHGHDKIDELDESKVSALHYAARQNSLQIMEILLSHGAHVDIKAAGGLTPLHFAARFKISQHQDQAGLKTNYKAALEEENDNAADPAINLLVRYGADVNIKDRYK